jgi:hypothetical protein
LSRLLRKAPGQINQPCRSVFPIRAAGHPAIYSAAILRHLHDWSSIAQCFFYSFGNEQWA